MLTLPDDSPAELIWRCFMWKYMEKFLAVILGCMSVAILLAEATLLPSGLDLSLFSIMIKSVGKEEVLVQVFSHIFLMFSPKESRTCSTIVIKRAAVYKK